MGVREELSLALTPQPAATSIALVAEADAAERLARILQVEDLYVAVRVSSLDHLSGHADPTVVVLVTSDVEPELAGPAEALHAMLPEARVVVVAPSATLRSVRALLADRVDALVLESDVERCLGLVVRAVSAGQISFPRSLRGNLARPALSAREKQVLGMVVLGFTNREIAAKLHLAESTVKSHLSTCFTKLGVRSRAEAADLILDSETGLGTGILAISDE